MVTDDSPFSDLEFRYQRSLSAKSRDIADAAEHERKTHDQKTNEPHQEYQQIHIHGVTGVFRTAETGFHHGESGLEEEYQHAA